MAKKRKSKNLVLPLLGISLFTMLGITIYLNRPRPTPLRIAEVTAPASNCSSVAFTDTFSGTALNDAKWFQYSETNGTATINNQLTFSIPSGKTNGTISLFSGGKVEIDGDFIEEITINSLFTTPITSNAASLGLGFVTATGDWKHWYRIEVYKNGDIQTHTTTDSVTTSGTSVNAFKNTPTKLKLIRSGTTLTTYYDVGSGYVKHSTISNIYAGKVSLQIFSLAFTPDSPAVTAVVKDFSLKCRPPVPTGLTSTCSPDGRKISLKWDDNSPSKKYTFSLDDTTESNGDLWFKKDTTDVWHGGDYASNTAELPIYPGRKYNWSIQTNLSGPSSDQSDKVLKSFTCTSTVSAPLNLRVTCNPDGKSVRLIWDGTVDVESYKVRLDDKNGHVTNFDNLKEPQYIATISPDKAYSFWVHSHKGGFDSNQSTAVDFTCKATATPTPTPTPKPTIKPTPKPTVTPTITPKASIYTPPVQNQTNEFNLPDDNAPVADATPQSKNPIASFFRWLASLFE